MPRHGSVRPGTEMAADAEDLYRCMGIVAAQRRYRKNGDLKKSLWGKYPPLDRPWIDSLHSGTVDPDHNGIRPHAIGSARPNGGEETLTMLSPGKYGVGR